jgi:hypothetical protein
MEAPGGVELNTGSMLREFVLELIKQAPSIAILLYLLVRQDNFIQYLVQQCIVAVNH